MKKIHRRWSRLQKAILEELETTKDKLMRPDTLSFLVANRYAPEKIWRLKDVKEPLAYALASNIHRKKELVRNMFSASFSRALRLLEAKGEIQLVKGRFDGNVENNSFVYYRIITPQPRVTLVVHRKSQYYGKKSPDVSRFLDIVNEVKFGASSDVNNNKR
jgi:hypothetical protein